MLALIGICAFLTAALALLATSQALTANRTQLLDRIDGITDTGADMPWEILGRQLLRIDSYSSLPLLQRFLAGRPRTQRMAENLRRAGMEPRVGAYVLLTLGLGLGGMLVVWQVQALPGPLRLILAVVALLVGLNLPRWYVRRRIRSRREQIEKALPDGLGMVSRALRSGSGLLIALSDMASQIGGPLGLELRQFEGEVAGGLSVEQAFHDLDERVRSRDLHIAVTAILIQREVGGNLSEVLDNIAGMMRDRTRLRGDVKALVSRQVYSTYILAATPWVIAGMLILMDTSMFLPFYKSPAGWIVIAIAGLFELVGYLVVKKIASAPIEI
jgi:tight adherence protein B